MAGGEGQLPPSPCLLHTLGLACTEDQKRMEAGDGGCVQVRRHESRNQRISCIIVTCLRQPLLVLWCRIRDFGEWQGVNEDWDPLLRSFPPGWKALAADSDALKGLR